MNQQNYIFYLTLLLSILFFSDAVAQKKIPWQKRAKMAADFEKSGDLQQAANYYQGVFNEKKDKLEYSYKAGICFLELRDYEKAIKSLEVVEHDNEKYEKAGYKYALALKQAGLIDKAKEAFNAFLLNYKGADKDIYQEFVENEIRGCNYVLKAQEYTNPAITLQHLDVKINSNKTEFAPIPFSDNVLYFSSLRPGVAKIYRSIKQDGKWVEPQIPTIFVGMERTHFGNGSFTENGKIFYFTQCDMIDGKPQCAIYLMEDLGNGKWSKPTILPDYINPENFNTTHPFILTIEDQEVLYFSSNRTGGRGGLDLWYSTRPIGSEIKNFTLPKNLGRNINSYGDEISPFYHKSSGTLYFSSNGRVSAGGLDIFKSKGEKLQWEVAQNMGFPINSSSDDLYYTVSEAHRGGYLVSNRTALPARTSTIDDDIFYFEIEVINIDITGGITQVKKAEKGLLKDVNVKLFKKASDGNEELVGEQMLIVGEYEFKDLTPNASYFIVVTKENFEEVNIAFTTGDKSEAIKKDIELTPLDVVVKEEVNPQDIRHYIVAAKYNSNTNAYQLPMLPIDPKTGLEYSGDTLEIFYEFDAVAGLGDDHKLYYNEEGIPQPYQTSRIAKGVADKDVPDIVDGPYRPSKIAPANISYKIQVSAVRKFRADKYEGLKEIGHLAMEDIDGGFKRILVVNKEYTKDGGDGFKRKSDALNTLSHILNNTKFEYAFVVKYVDGKRVGEGFRGWNEEEGLETDTRPDGYIPKDVYEGF